MFIKNREYNAIINQRDILFEEVHRIKSENHKLEAQLDRYRDIIISLSGNNHLFDKGNDNEEYSIRLSRVAKNRELVDILLDEYGEED